MEQTTDEQPLLMVFPVQDTVGGGLPSQDSKPTEDLCARTPCDCANDRVSVPQCQCQCQRRSVSVRVSVSVSDIVSGPHEEGSG